MNISSIFSRCFCCAHPTQVEELEKPSIESSTDLEKVARAASPKTRWVYPPNAPPRVRNLQGTLLRAEILHPIEQKGVINHQGDHLQAPPIPRRVPSPSSDSNSQFLADRAPCLEELGAAQSLKISAPFQSSYLNAESSIIRTKDAWESERLRSGRQTPSTSSNPFRSLRAPHNFTIADAAGVCGLGNWAIAKNKKGKNALEVFAFKEELQILFNKNEHQAQFFAVCKGKNGIAAVDNMKENMARNLQLALQKMVTSFGRIEGISDTIVFHSLLQAFATTNHLFEIEMSAILIIEGKLWPILLGESSLLLSNKGISSQITYPALERDLNLQLMSISEEVAQPGIPIPNEPPTSVNPRIFQPIALLNLSPDHFFVIASKEISNVCDPHKLLEEICEEDTGVLVDKACKIIDFAIHAGAKESCTAVVIQYNGIGK